MARIPDTDLQRLKDEVSVQRLIEAAGVELRKAGKDWAGIRRAIPLLESRG